MTTQKADAHSPEKAPDTSTPPTGGSGVPAAPAAVAAPAPAKPRSSEHRVKATREGRVGSKTASGYEVDLFVPFVALPCRAALHAHVRLVNPKNGRSAMAVVLDVGPWFENDDKYVFGNARPLAEIRKIDERGRKPNGSGIDLGEWVWKQLGMEDNTEVIWEFLPI